MIIHAFWQSFELGHLGLGGQPKDNLCGQKKIYLN